MVDACRFNLHIIFPHSYFERRLLSLNRSLFVYLPNYLMSNLTFYSLWTSTVTLIYLELHPRNLFITGITWIKAHKSSALVFVVVYGSQVVSQFFVDEVLIIEDFFYVFFGIVIELDNKKKDHGEEVLEGDAVGRFGALPGEELIEELNFLLFGGFEYFDFVILVLPIPLMNSG